MRETLKTGVGPACGEKVWGRDWGALRSTGQRHGLVPEGWGGRVRERNG